MRKSHRSLDLDELGRSVMDIVAQVASRRLVQVLEEVTETNIKPL